MSRWSGDWCWPLFSRGTQWSLFNVLYSCRAIDDLSIIWKLFFSGEASSVEGQADNDDVEELAEADQAHSDPQGSPQQVQGANHALSQVQQNVQVSPRFYTTDIPGPSQQLTEQNSLNRYCCIWNGILHHFKRRSFCVLNGMFFIL